MIMATNKDKVLLQMAWTASRLSTCARRPVGCVLVDPQNRIIATGYNGVPRGLRHCTKENPCPGYKFGHGEGLDHCMAIHAEQNALMHCGDILNIWKCYVTSSPCKHCIKMLMNTSCDELVYTYEYDAGALDMWRKSGREATQIIGDGTEEN
jgi:dCMP deaminase